MKKLTYHFIGIGGVSMSSLALYLKHKGYNVQGSDISNQARQKLAKYNIQVFTKHNKSSINCADIVVYSFAIKDDNVELLEAKRQNKIILSRAELLGQIAKDFKNVISVAGSHGKTSTTAMIYSCLKQAGKNPTLHIGGELYGSNFGLILGDSNYFITEACEYHDSFLKLNSNIGIILNIEPEHLDYFGNFENEINSYKKFAKNSKKIIAFDNGYINDSKIITFGKENSDVIAKNIKLINGKYEYDVYINKKYFLHITLGAQGEYNITNSLAAIYACKLLGIKRQYISQGLKEYTPVKRRYEILSQNPYIVHDYAHHPTEIQNTIKTFTRHTNSKILVVFQPHTYSRTKTLMNEFLNCFGKVHKVLFIKTYSAREKYDKTSSAYSLYKKYKQLGKSCDYSASFNVAKTKIERLICKGYSVLILGAGDVCNLAYKFKKV